MDIWDGTIGGPRSQERAWLLLLPRKMAVRQHCFMSCPSSQGYSGGEVCWARLTLVLWRERFVMAVFWIKGLAVRLQVILESDSGVLFEQRALFVNALSGLFNLIICIQNIPGIDELSWWFFFLAITITVKQFVLSTGMTMNADCCLDGKGYTWLANYEYPWLGFVVAGLKARVMSQLSSAWVAGFWNFKWKG